MNVYFVYITTSDSEESGRIARAIVADRLAACANVLDGVTSVYWWGDELVDASESAVIAKTAEDRLKGLRERVTELHSYDLPCVVAMPIAEVSAEYRAWIVAETREKAVVDAVSD